MPAARYAGPMRPQEVLLRLAGDPSAPPSRRAMQTVVEAIRAGRLKPGDALPGSRALADMLGLNRNTVIAAVQELEAEGWLETLPNRGTFVAAALPDSGGATAAPMPDEAGFDLPSRLSPLSAVEVGTLNLADGLPDARIFPAKELAKAYQRAMERHGANLLQGGEAMGHGLLRQELAKWLAARRGLAVDPKAILVTRGIRNSLSLLALALVKEGEAIAVENPGNRAAWDTLQQGGKGHILSVPVDAEGLVVGALEALLAKEKVRFLLTTPQRQWPTTVAMSEARRKALLDLAQTHRLALVEDDHDSEYTFGEAPLLPLASQDRGGHVVYLASLSRLTAPGLNLGVMVGPEPLIARLAKLQKQLEWQGDPVVEWAVADLFRDGILDAHLRKARKLYQARRDFFLAELERRFKSVLSARTPSGGLALWARAKGVDLDAWVAAAKAKGLILHPPAHFFRDEPEPFTRLGFAHLDEEETAVALDRLAACRLK